MTGTNHIIVKDYLYDGNYIFGSFYEQTSEEDIKYLLDDGDIRTVKDLKEGWGCEVIGITSEDIINAFKGKFKQVKSK